MKLREVEENLETTRVEENQMHIHLSVEELIHLIGLKVLLNI